MELRGMGKNDAKKYLHRERELIMKSTNKILKPKYCFFVSINLLFQHVSLLHTKYGTLLKSIVLFVCTTNNRT